MSDVFVCYAREDQAFVRSLHEALSEREREAWVDWEGIPLAAKWLEEIHGAIDAAHCVVFVISPDSVVSDVCRQEIDYAVEHGKRLVPVVRRGVPAADVHPALRQLNWLFFREADGFEAALAALLQAIDADLPWVRAHTRLLTRALEWERRDRDASYLLRGTDLEEARRWLREAAGREPALTDVHTQYLMASQEYALEEQDRWKNLYDKALARLLAAQSELTRTLHPGQIERAVLLAAEALRRVPLAECDRALRGGLAILPKPVGVASSTYPVHALAVSPDGCTLAVSGPAEVTLHELPGGRKKGRLEVGKAGEPGRLVFSSDGTRLAAISGVRHNLAHTFMFAMAYGASDPGPGKRPVGDVTSTVVVWELPGGRELARVAHEIHELKGAAFSPDGHTLATAGQDGTARLWRLPGGAEVTRLAHEPRVNQVVFAEDGATLATAGGDKSARVWDTSGREVARVTHDGEVAAVALEDERGASAGFDRKVKVWSASNGQPWVSFTAVAPVERLFLRGSHVIAVCEGHTVQAWSWMSRKEEARRAHPGRVLDVAFPAERVRTSCIDHRVARVFDSALSPTEDEGEVLRVAHGGDAGVTHVALAPDGGCVVTGGDSACRVWEPGDGALALELEHDLNAERLTFGRGGRVLASATGGAAVSVWSLPDGARIRELEHEGVSHLLFGADDQMLVTASDDGQLLVHGLQGGARRELRIPYPPAGGASLALRSDGARLVAGDRQTYGQNRVHLWDPRDGREVMSLVCQGRFAALVFTPDGRGIVGGGRSLWFLDAETGRSLGEVPTGTRDPSGGCKALVFAPDGRSFVSSEGYADGSYIRAPAVVRGAGDGRELARLADGEPLGRVEFAPSGDALAAADGERIRVWAAKDLRELEPLIHESFVASFAWSADGQHLASASADGVRMWRVADASEVARVQPRRHVRQVALSPDGALLAVRSQSRFVRLWWWRPDDMLLAARARVTRALTRKEWARFMEESPTPGTRLRDRERGRRVAGTPEEARHSIAARSETARCRSAQIFSTVSFPVGSSS